MLNSAIYLWSALFAIVGCFNPTHPTSNRSVLDSLSTVSIPSTVNPSQTSLRIKKSEFKLELLENGQVLKTYPVVLGFNPTNDKLREGDGCTPEGKFKLKAKYPHKSWSYFLWVDYPTADSYTKHDAAKRKGSIPKDAAIGGEIGIHGVPAGRNDLIKNSVNWTLGCISLRTEDISEIYPLVKEGTPIEIFH